MVCEVDTRQALHHLRFTGRTTTAQGLGKTITALSLILSTRGVRPKPLPGTAAQTVTDHKGRQACYYLVDPESKPALHAAAIGSSRRSGRESQPVRRFEAEAGMPKIAWPKDVATSGRATSSRQRSGSALAGQPMADPVANKEQGSARGAMLGPPQAPADAIVSAGSLQQRAALEWEGSGPRTKRQKREEPGDDLVEKDCGAGEAAEPGKTRWPGPAGSSAISAINGAPFCRCTVHSRCAPSLRSQMHPMQSISCNHMSTMVLLFTCHADIARRSL